jgi:16S rRNA processing protein RimM
MTATDHPGTPQESTGSSVSGEPEFLAIGKLRRPHGIRGEMLMDVLTDFPERLTPGVHVFIGEAHKLTQPG